MISSDRHSMIVTFARKLMSFHSSSIFDDFFSIPSMTLYVLSFTSNDIIHIFHNKLDFPLNFSTSNLVVVIILLAIALIQIVVKRWYNKRETPSWRLGNGNRDKSPYNQRTLDLMWFDKRAYVHTEEGRNFIENREVKYKSYKNISLTTLNGGNILNSLLDLPSKATPRGLYRP